MTTQTMVFGTTMRRSEKWRRYQLRTANSTYELEVQSPTPSETRRCCVLTCVSPANRAGQTFEDSSPRAGDASLYAVSPLEWMGQCLTVGTARTSEVQSVEFMSESDGPTPRRTGNGSQSLVFGQPASNSPAAVASPKPKAEEPLQWAPFPLGYVQMAEAAASLLQVLNNRVDVQNQLRAEPLLRRRLEHALSTCRLMLEVLDRDA
jgi:hypothetical protein